MKHTAKRMEVIITTEDKGSAVVVLDTENYIKEANSQLFDKINYKTLQTDRALQHDKLGNDTLDQFKNKKILSKTTAEELKVINPKTSKFYITPKIHKKIIQDDLSSTQSTVASQKLYALLTISFNF